MSWLVSAAAMVGCGGRTGGEFGEEIEPGAGSGGSAASSPSAGRAGSGDGGSRPGDAGVAGQPMPTGGSVAVGGSTGVAGSGSAGFPPLDGGAGECVRCISAMCPEAQACAQDPACVQGAFCAFTTCVSNQGGGAGLDCWLGCFADNPDAALTAFSAFQCIASNCGMDCASGLGG